MLVLLYEPGPRLVYLNEKQDCLEADALKGAGF